MQYEPQAGLVILSGKSFYVIQEVHRLLRRVTMLQVEAVPDAPNQGCVIGPRQVRRFSAIRGARPICRVTHLTVH